MPCVHFTGVVTQYRNYYSMFPDVLLTLDTRALKIEYHFHVYWKQTGTAFMLSQTYLHWEEAATERPVAAVEFDMFDRDEELARVAREERARLTTYSTSKSLHDQIFRLVQSFGPVATAQWDQYLVAEVTQMRSQRFPEVTGSVVLATTDDVSNTTTIMICGRGQSTRVRAVKEPRVCGRGRGHVSRARGDRRGGPGGA